MSARKAIVITVAAVAALAFSAVAYAGVPVAPGTAQSSEFIPSSGCGCHDTLVRQWSESMHSKAITDPVFLFKVDEAKRAVGVPTAIFCKRCHAPVGNMTGDFDATASEVAAEGVTCMFCHQILAVNGDPVNVALILQPDLTRRAQLKEPVAPHPAAYSELHDKAEICGACHNVSHPTSGVHLETSYSEWAASPYASEGVTCQDCHMSRKAGFIGPSPGTAGTGAPPRDNIYEMTFVGANVGQGAAAASEALLKTAATVEIKGDDIVAPSTTASVSVTVTNVGAGHYLPTGLTEVREMWLRIYADTGSGEPVELGERRFGTVLEDAKGAYPAEMWEAVAVHSDDRIPPRESVTGQYAFTMPEAAEEATIVAVLNYRSLPDDLATAAGVDNPVTTMAEATVKVYASKEARDGKPATPPAEDTDRTAWWPYALGIVLVAAAAVAYGLTRAARAKKDGGAGAA